MLIFLLVKYESKVYSARCTGAQRYTFDEILTLISIKLQETIDYDNSLRMWREYDVPTTGTIPKPVSSADDQDERRFETVRYFSPLQ